MAIKHELIRLLSDGKFHSGEELGEALHLTRSAIWKVTAQLVDMGIELHRIKGKGYQIPTGIELLQIDQIQRHLSISAQSQSALLLENEITSTNQYLFDQRAKLSSGTILFAEYQSKGRARRQREWLSPYASGICCSVLWKFNKDPSELMGLSLAVGVALVNALERYGIHQTQLKWPNDLLWQFKKLAGVLIEMTAESYSETEVVIGVGVNINLPKKAQIGQSWIDIATIMGQKPNRNQLAAYIIEELLEMLVLFQAKGFGAFVKHWQSLDAYYNHPVTVITPQNEVAGIAKGITKSGELVLETLNRQELRFANGEVSLRPVS